MIWADGGDFYVQEEKDFIRGGTDTDWEEVDDTGHAAVPKQAAGNEQAYGGCKRDSSQAAEKLNITKPGVCLLTEAGAFLF